MRLFFILSIAFIMLHSCKSPAQHANNSMYSLREDQPATAFKEGGDYTLFERVRFIDKEGFQEPTEAYSMLFPKGWTCEGDIVWNQPGSSCPGTYQVLDAHSKDGQYRFQFLPSLTFNWSPDSPGPMSGQGSCVGWREPATAEEYLREDLARELDNAEIISVGENPNAVAELRINDQSTIAEMQSYGAGAMDIRHTAVNARVRWNNGQEGQIALSSTIMHAELPNAYGGPTEQIYTTSIKRTVFRYPAKDSMLAERSFAVILSSIRTNPGWKDAVNGFWREARRLGNQAHRANLQATDAATAAMTKAHEGRMRDIEAWGANNTRAWEAKQSAIDRTHTAFVKIIRGVENYRDESGKYEMTAGYDHVWSRGDGDHFIMSNNPNFDPSAVLQDQRWKQMKKVE